MNNLFNNILSNGSIIASPSKEPDYNFHWVRDSAIIIKSLIDCYNINKMNSWHGNSIKYKTIFNKYIDIELKHINYHPAEPKFHIDGTPYEGDWGRPQNDGPALRGIVCLKLIRILPNRLTSLIKIINTDINYTIAEIDEPSFDLWEEQYGYHLYTRIIQYKFLHTVKHISNKFRMIEISAESLQKSKVHFYEHFSHDNKIYSSYSVNGQVLREYDSSILLAFSFVDYSIPSLSVDDYRIRAYVNSLVNHYNKVYPINNKTNIPFLGRYYNDVYFNGNPWLITTIALFNYYCTINEILNYKTPFINLIAFIKQKNMLLSEQIDKNTGENISVDKLTWNYAELILLNVNIKKLKIEDTINLFIF